MKKFYLVLIIFFIIMALIVFRSVKNTFKRLDYLDKLDEKKDKK